MSRWQWASLLSDQVTLDVSLWSYLWDLVLALICLEELPHFVVVIFSQLVLFFCCSLTKAVDSDTVSCHAVLEFSVHSQNLVVKFCLIYSFRILYFKCPWRLCKENYFGLFVIYFGYIKIACDCKKYIKIACDCKKLSRQEQYCLDDMIN